MKNETTIERIERDNGLSKISNSPIGSHHWAATLLSFVMRVGEYMKDHGIEANDNHYREWGKHLLERAHELNEYLQSIPEDVGDRNRMIDKIISDLNKMKL